MRAISLISLFLTLAAPAWAGLGVTVNPFGVPANGGTGIALSWEGTGTELVTAQYWSFAGEIYNYDNGAGGAMGLLIQPPAVQLQSEAGFVGVFGANDAPGGYPLSDSYWGDFWAGDLLGAGITGGTNNPGAAATTMGLDAGTTFSTPPDASELLIYLVIAAPITFSGEFAVGTSTIETYGGTLYLDGSIATCGDGMIEPPEQCDDGATSAGDGCSAVCLVEPGWVCAGTPSICTPVVCGDGLIEGTEQCDDGGTASGDGCSSACAFEPGFKCAPGEPSVCSPLCNGATCTNACQGFGPGNDYQDVDVTMAGTVSGSGPVLLSNTTMSVEFPSDPLLALYPSGLLSPGPQSIPVTGSVTIESPTTGENFQSATFSTTASSVITDPDGTPGTGDETATPLVVDVVVANTSWTPGQPDPSFRQMWLDAQFDLLGIGSPTHFANCETGFSVDADLDGSLETSQPVTADPFAPSSAPSVPAVGVTGRAILVLVCMAAGCRAFQRRRR